MPSVWCPSRETWDWNGPLLCRQMHLRPLVCADGGALEQIRHLAVADLWVQDKVRSGAFILKRIAGELNASDVLTKFAARPLMNKHLKTLSLRMASGRSSLAPTI